MRIIYLIAFQPLTPLDVAHVNYFIYKYRNVSIIIIIATVNHEGVHFDEH